MGITVDIGEMREVVVFKTNTPTNTDSGGQEEQAVWTTLLTTRGRLRRQSGARRYDGGIVAQESGFELVTRYQAAIQTALDAGMTSVEITNGGRTFIIDSVEVINQRFAYYVFKLNEKHI